MLPFDVFQWAHEVEQEKEVQSRRNHRSFIALNLAQFSPC